MRIIGEKPLATDADGRLLSRIGTIFLRTPGLVTTRGIHALQRQTWIDTLNADRKTPLSENEIADELAESVDLVFAPETILIRPDPNRMDLALRADEALQAFVSKRQIRFLNTHSAKVRDALRARGENWRMAHPPTTAEDIDARIAGAKCAIGGPDVYFYNRHTGTRYLTVGGFERVLALEDDVRSRTLTEIVRGMNTLNRLGQPEIDLFPRALPVELRTRFRRLDSAASASVTAALMTEYRTTVPAELRVESLANFDWRNEMFHTLMRGPSETAADEQDLVQGISPEFYRQIEWLPGGRIDEGRLVFDTVLDDHRVRSIIFNFTRLFASLEYVNVGRIAHSLARKPVAGARRAGMYLVQCKEKGAEQRLYVMRFQKWGVAEYLDEGRDLLSAVMQAEEYADYILDRRLACLQLGMNLPKHIGFGQLTERYGGANRYDGTTVRAHYFVRGYVSGTASDKIPPARFANPAFAHRFAELMGAAAAVDLVVGRAATETRECVFDKNYETVQFDAAGLPSEVVVTDHAGSFVRYEDPLADLVAPYAEVARRRAKFVTAYAVFAQTYADAFGRRLAELQAAYRANPRAYTDLFAERPYDEAGSAAYRWSCVLKRLDSCDPAALAADLLKRCAL